MYVRYIPTIRMSPWAKLITRITPKMSVRPMPMSAYTPPIRMPLMRDCRNTAMGAASSWIQKGAP